MRTRVTVSSHYHDRRGRRHEWVTGGYLWLCIGCAKGYMGHDPEPELDEALIPTAQTAAPSPRRTLWSIDWPTGKGKPNFGIVESGGTVVEAAPIARWAEGKPIESVLDWYRKKGAEVRQL